MKSGVKYAGSHLKNFPDLMVLKFLSTGYLEEESTRKLYTHAKEMEINANGSRCFL